MAGPDCAPPDYGGLIQPEQVLLVNRDQPPPTLAFPI
jgi:hypothetical protein